MKFNPCLESFFQRQINGQAVLNIGFTVKRSASPAITFCLNDAVDSLRQYTGDAGKDSLDGIRNFAGFGS